MPTNRIVLPAIYMPLPVASHQRAQLLEEETIEFLRRHGFIDDRERELELRAAGFGKLAALTLPHGDFELAQIQSDIVALLFLTDDTEIEQPALAGSLRRVADHCMTSVRALRNPDIDPGAGKYRALTEVVLRLRNIVTLAQLDRFVGSLIDQYLASCCEVMHLAQGVIPSIENYNTIRLATAWDLGLEFFIEMSHHCELDGSMRWRPDILELRTSAMRIICYCQDLLTGVREVELGTTFNMPMIIARERGISLQHAFDHLADLLNAEVRRFTVLSDRLLASHSHRNLRHWLRGWTHWASGHYVWCMQSGRYQLTMPEAIME
jgi:hypothetical protein